MTTVDAVWLCGGPVVRDRLCLRYSIRSVTKNASWIRDVWIVGDPPAWLSARAGTIRLPPLTSKWEDIRQSLTAAATCDYLADRILVFNDDHYLTRTIPTETDLPVIHLGDTRRYLAHLAETGFNTGNTWYRAVQATDEWAQHHGATGLCYASHSPLLFDRAKLARALDQYPADRLLDYPGLYEFAGCGGAGTFGDNAKVVGDNDFRERRTRLPWLSTVDSENFTASTVGRFITQRFNEPCAYEKIREGDYHG